MRRRSDQDRVRAAEPSLSGEGQRAAQHGDQCQRGGDHEHIEAESAIVLMVVPRPK
jgi:hypothetical protein